MKISCTATGIRSLASRLRACREMSFSVFTSAWLICNHTGNTIRIIKGEFCYGRRDPRRERRKHAHQNFTFFTSCIVLLLLQIIPIKCTHFNVLIYNTPKFFGSQWPIIRQCSCTKPSAGHTTIFNIPNCGEIINVRYTEANMYTLIGAAYRVEYVLGVVFDSIMNESNQ